MQNIKLFEFDSDYQSDKVNHEYPCVSYVKDTDKVYYFKPSLIIDASGNITYVAEATKLANISEELYHDLGGDKIDAINLVNGTVLFKDGNEYDITSYSWYEWLKSIKINKDGDICTPFEISYEWAPWLGFNYYDQYGYFNAALINIDIESDNLGRISWPG